MPNRKPRKKKAEYRALQNPPKMSQCPDEKHPHRNAKKRIRHEHTADSAELQHSTVVLNSSRPVTSNISDSGKVYRSIDLNDVFRPKSVVKDSASAIKFHEISETGAHLHERNAHNPGVVDDGQRRNLDPLEGYVLNTSISETNPGKEAAYPLEKQDMHTEVSAEQQDVFSLIQKFASIGSSDKESDKAVFVENVQKIILNLKKADTSSLSQDVLNSLLMAACRQGHKFLVQTLVRIGASVHTRDTCGFTPLLICADKGFTDIARFLVKKKADVNTANSAGDTALILSIRPAGSVDMTKFLLEQKGIDVDHQNHQGYTALKKAVEAMDVDTVKLLIDKQKCSERYKRRNRDRTILRQKVLCNVETLEEIANRIGLGRILKLLQENQDKDGMPLLKAALEHDEESFNILIDSHFSEHQEGDKNNDKILGQILQEHLKNSETLNAADIAIIKTLLANGADVNQKRNWSSCSDAPIITATKIGSFELVQLLCRHGANLDVKAYRDDKDPVMIAAENGKSDIINLLISFGGRVNKRRPRYRYGDEDYIYENSALDLTLRKGHTDCARLLRGYGAEMNVSAALSSAVEHRTETYLNYLLDNFRTSIQKLLRDKEKSPGNRLLCKAIRYGDVAMVTKLLDSGCNVNYSSGHEIPLMEAKSSEMIQLLIRRGADINQRGGIHYGRRTALLQAVSKEYSYDEGIIKVLLESGACVDEADTHGRTPLAVVAGRFGSLNVLGILLNHGADVSKKDSSGRTPLMHAVDKRCTENAEILIEFISKHGMDLDVQDNNRSTALMAATNDPQTEIIKLLIEKGANVNLEDDGGNTPLLLAAGSHTKTEALSILIKSGADVNHHNKAGYTALMKASQNINKEALQMLMNSGSDVNKVSVINNATALSVLLDNFRLTASDYSCAEYLLEQGASASSVTAGGLLRIIQDGHMQLIPKLMSRGLGPAEGQSNSVMVRRVSSFVSPLCLALLEGKVDLARYFHGNWFLTNSDVSSLPKNENLRQELQRKGHKDCLQFLDEIKSQPMSLLKLSFVAVSSAIGCVTGREDKVNSLPLPSLLKEKLLFKREDVTLHVPNTLTRSGLNDLGLANREILFALLHTRRVNYVYSGYDYDDFDRYDYSDYFGYYDSDDY